jgi:hypothetical protein
MIIIVLVFGAGNDSAWTGSALFETKQPTAHAQISIQSQCCLHLRHKQKARVIFEPSHVISLFCFANVSFAC